MVTVIKIYNWRYCTYTELNAKVINIKGDRLKYALFLYLSYEF
jgi:hypothetical protein